MIIACTFCSLPSFAPWWDVFWNSNFFKVREKEGQYGNVRLLCWKFMKVDNFFGTSQNGIVDHICGTEGVQFPIVYMKVEIEVILFPFPKAPYAGQLSWVTCMSEDRETGIGCFFAGKTMWMQMPLLAVTLETSDALALRKWPNLLLSGCLGHAVSLPVLSLSRSVRRSLSL